MEFIRSMKFDNAKELGDFLTRKLIHYKVESIQVERSEEGLKFIVTARGKSGLGRIFEKKLNIKDISEHEGLDADNKAVYSFNTEEFKEFIKEAFSYDGRFDIQGEKIFYIQNNGVVEDHTELIKEYIEQAIYLGVEANDFEELAEKVIIIAEILGMKTEAQDARIALDELD